MSDPSRRGVYPRSLKPQDVWPLSKENCWQQAEAVLFQLGMNKNMILPFFFAYRGKKKKKTNCYVLQKMNILFKLIFATGAQTRLGGEIQTPWP